MSRPERPGGALAVRGRDDRFPSTASAVNACGEFPRSNPLIASIFLLASRLMPERENSFGAGYHDVVCAREGDHRLSRRCQRCGDGGGCAEHVDDDDETPDVSGGLGFIGREKSSSHLLAPS